MAYLNFKANNLAITRDALRLYFRSEIEPKATKVRIYAFNSYMSSLDNNLQALEEPIKAWLQQSGVKEVTLCESDILGILAACEETETFKKFARDALLNGNGKTGCGVYNKLTGTIVECAYGNHLIAILDILEQEHKDIYIEYMVAHSNKSSFDIVDKFVTENLILFGNTYKDVKDYFKHL